METQKPKIDPLVDPLLATRGVREPKLLPDANDLPGDGLEEHQVVRVVLPDLRVHQIVPDWENFEKPIWQKRKYMGCRYRRSATPGTRRVGSS